MSFPLYQQLDAMDCGPSCLRMVAAHHGRQYTLEYLRDLSAIGRGGVSLRGISEGAETIGMRTLAASLPFKTLRDDVPLPCIVHWDQNHFVVVYKVTRSRVYVADPESGLLTYKRRDFLRGWIPHVQDPTDETRGILLLLEPTPTFMEHEGRDAAEKRGLSFFYSYLLPHKKLLFQLVIGFLFFSVLELVFPFLTQAVVDYGIGNQDMQFIYVLLAAQLMLTFSQGIGDMIRSWIMLHVGSRISISLISDFLNKLLKLPIAFFDTRTAGDIMQRIEDHERINRLLTSGSLDVVSSVFRFFIFGTVLAFYNLPILGVYLGITVVSACYLLLFLKRRRVLDTKQFSLDAKEQDKLVELVTASQEIKIQGIEKEKRWEWESINARMFKLAIQRHILRQTESGGTLFLSQIRNVLVVFLAARAVISGDMTLGMMLSTQYMLGQLSSPIRQLTSLIHSGQDAKLSLERMQEVYHQKEDEDYTRKKLHHFPESRSLALRDDTFRYPGAGNKDVLKNVHLEIPEGKITAIVGASGGGKTTLLKLLLNLYLPSSGEIQLGQTPLRAFDSRAWRDRCGVVMQDGFIFSYTIGRNITCHGENPDRMALHEAVTLANLDEWTSSLPNGLDTKIGNDGQDISGGQKQRLLIARAIYRNPEFVFLDEATSSLDARTEYAIMHNLANFVRGRTVVVIAHRLSTVKNADQIVVLDGGEVAESGTHDQLVAARGSYWELVRNQLELAAEKGEVPLDTSKRCPRRNNPENQRRKIASRPRRLRCRPPPPAFPPSPISLSPRSRPSNTLRRRRPPPWRRFPWLLRPDSLPFPA